MNNPVSTKASKKSKNKKEYCCEICPYKVKSKGCLSRHSENHFKNDIIRQNEQRCKYCNYVTSKRQIQRHVNLHTQRQDLLRAKFVRSNILKAQRFSMGLKSKVQHKPRKSLANRKFLGKYQTALISTEETLIGSQSENNERLTICSQPENMISSLNKGFLAKQECNDAKEIKSSLIQDFYSLLKNEKLCDLEFICSDSPVLAHCAIVACRSPYCHRLIKLNKETQNQNDKPVKILLQQENSVSLKKVLEFLYTDNINSFESNDSELDTLKLTVDVFKIANQFELAKLKNICKNSLKSSFTCENILDVLVYTLKINGLKEVCMEFIFTDQNYNKIIEQNDMLPSYLVIELMRLNENVLHLSTSNIIQEVLESSSLEKDFEFFFTNDNEFHDVEIVLNDGSLKAHKCFLAARSKMFYQRFLSIGDSRDIASINDLELSFTALCSVLKFIYHDQVLIPFEDALYLYSIRHDMVFTNERFRDACQNIIKTNISKENCLEIFKLSHSICDCDLKISSLQVIRDNYEELVKSCDLQSLTKEALIEIMKNIIPISTLDANDIINA